MFLDVPLKKGWYGRENMKGFLDLTADKREKTDDKKVEGEMLGLRLRMVHGSLCWFMLQLAIGN